MCIRDRCTDERALGVREQRVWQTLLLGPPELRARRVSGEAEHADVLFRPRVVVVAVALRLARAAGRICLLARTHPRVGEDDRVGQVRGVHVVAVLVNEREVRQRIADGECAGLWRGALLLGRRPLCRALHRRVPGRRVLGEARRASWGHLHIRIIARHV